MTTPADLIRLALRDAGVNGVGQSPSAEDNNDAFTHLNLMLAQWNRKRWLIYRLVDVPLVSTGALSYSVGPGGDFNVPRPDRIEAAFARFVTTSPQTDFPVQVLQSREDYNLVYAKTVGTQPYYVWYDAAYPLGQVYWYPVASAGQYEMHLSLKAELTAFPDLTTAINLPPEYQEALLYNLAVRLRVAYQMPADPQVLGLAKAALNTIRGANTQVPMLRMPSAVMGRRGRYSIYSDR